MNHALLLRPIRIVFLGAPGAGKGTYASRLSKTWRLPCIATGDMIREEIQRETTLGAQFKDFANKGKLVPDSMVNDLAKSRLTQLDVLSTGYILDGYPRTVEQAQYLSTFAAPHLCVNITMPDKFLIAKISGRRVCKNCKCIYNVATIKEGLYDMPPLLPKDGNRCDQCQHTLTQRDDDQPAVVEDRLKVYRDQTAPLIGYYMQQQQILETFEVYKGVADLPDLAELILKKLSSHKK